MKKKLEYKYKVYIKSYILHHTFCFRLFLFFLFFFLFSGSVTSRSGDETSTVISPQTSPNLLYSWVWHSGRLRDNTDWQFGPTSCGIRKNIYFLFLKYIIHAFFRCAKGAAETKGDTTKNTKQQTYKSNKYVFFRVLDVVCRRPSK